MNEDYATDPLLFYPGRRLSADERGKMDRYELPIDRITVDHLVYSMGKQIETNFQTFYTVAEDLIGEESALALAREIGRRYGGQGYARLLEAHGRPGVGEPREMALYQDLVHSIRGPKHVAALFAEYDDDRCIVRRTECVYFNEDTPQNGKYTEAFESGCFEGYVAADANMLRVDVIKCRYRGDAGCEQHWVFKPAAERVTPVTVAGLTAPATAPTP
jgi:hypothetical protein